MGLTVFLRQDLINSLQESNNDQDSQQFASANSINLQNSAGGTLSPMSFGKNNATALNPVAA
jgi:hypothetical protein